MGLGLPQSNDQLKFHSTTGLDNVFEIANLYQPDLIICNYTNKVDSIDLIKRLGGATTTQTIPILYLGDDHKEDFRRKIISLGADDYLLRPISTDYLLAAIKCRIKKQALLKEKMMEICRAALVAENKLPKKDDHILITIGNKLQLIKYKNIVCITALKEYSKLRTFQGKQIVVRKSLKSWIELLPPKGFLRIHRSSIINVEAIEKIQKLKERTYVVFLRTLDKPLELSQRYSNVMRNTFPS